MKPIQPRLLALIALSALACRTERAADGPAQLAEPRHESIPATPVIKAPAEKPKASEPAVARPAMPIVPSKAESVPAVNAEAGSRADRLVALVAEHEKAMDAYYDLYRNAKTDEEREKIGQTTKPPDVKPFRARARALLAEDATDMTAFGALKWLISNNDREDAAADDIAVLDRHHFERPEMLEILSPLQFARDPASGALLEKLAEKSPHRDVRGRAWMAKAEALKSEVSMIERVRGMTEAKEREEYVGFLGQTEFDRLAQLDPKVGEARVVAIYDQVVRDYADVPAARKGTIGDQARNAIFEMQNLVVGKVAPDIVGEDLDAVAFKLSDYRGKVVMLDFWGHW